MKKLFTIFLLGAMLLLSVGYYVVYRYNLSSIKKEMRLAIRAGDFNASELITLKFNASDPNSFKEVEVKEEGKEIRYKGEMYDVVAARFEGESLLVDCVRDKDETQVIAGFAKWLESGDAAITGKKSAKLIKYNFPFFTLVAASNTSPGTELAAFQCQIAFKATYIPQYYLNIPSPPPWQH